MDCPPSGKTQAKFTPKDFLKLIQIGTGTDFDRQGLKELAKEKGQKASELLGQMRLGIEKLTGFTPDELLELAPKEGFSAPKEYRDAHEEIDEGIEGGLPFLSKQLGIDANNYVDRLVKDYFSDDDSLQVSNEAKICNDATDLLLMAFNDEKASDVKYEAARKLLLMKFLGEIKNYNEQHEDNDGALQYMIELFNERVIERFEEERVGSTTSRYLVSWHDPITFEAIKTEIREEEPTDLGTDKPIKITQLPSHKAVVENELGEPRLIYFTLDPREKTDESRFTKTLRSDEQIGKRDVDRNGLRLVFEKREDWDDFFRSFKEDIYCEIGEELYKTERNGNDEEKREATKRLNNLSNSIEIYDDKDTLDGEEFNGSSASSSTELKVFKFKMRVTRADGRVHRYEFQIFLPDGYVDFKYRKGMSHEEYQGDRFFREGVDRTIFPEEYYDVDHEKAHDKVMRQRHQKVWNGKSSD